MFHGVFLVALVSLNWDYLVAEGIAVLVITCVLTAGTLVFYFLTGLTDPGYVCNQIFDNQYETTEFIEEENPIGEQNSQIAVCNKNINSSSQRQNN